MTLYELKIGKSKKKMQTQMIDSMSAINVYLSSRNGSKGKFGDGNWYMVTPAQPGAKQYQRKSSSIGGSKCHTVPRINKQGKTTIPGYVSKSGFVPHT